MLYVYEVSSLPGISLGLVLIGCFDLFFKEMSASVFINCCTDINSPAQLSAPRQSFFKLFLLQHYANFLFSVNVSLRTLTNWGGGGGAKVKKKTLLPTSIL